MLLRRLYIAIVVLAIILLIWEGAKIDRKLLGGTSLATFDDTCKWPPDDVADIWSADAFKLSICFRLQEDSFENGKRSKRYRMDEIFNVEPMNQTVSFDELLNISDDMQKKIRYPEIWKTYPQDVPIKEIIANVKAGKQINHVRILWFLMIHFYLHHLYN